MKILPFLLALSILLSLVACGPSPEEQAAFVFSAMTATAAAWTPTPTVTTTPTFTPTLTATPTVTLTATTKPTTTSTSTPTRDPSRFYSSDDLFSFVKLEGWVEQDAGFKYPVFIGPSMGDVRLNLVFFLDKNGANLDFYMDMLQETYADRAGKLVQISEKFLTTDEGKNFCRWVVDVTLNGKTARQFFYVYESGGWMLVGTYTRPTKYAEYYDDLVDATMRSVIFEH